MERGDSHRITPVVIGCAQNNPPKTVPIPGAYEHVMFHCKGKQDYRQITPANQLTLKPGYLHYQGDPNGMTRGF